MDRQWKWRTFVCAVLVIGSALSLVPTVVGVTSDEEDGLSLPSWFTQVFSQRMTLGLDLQGGIHLQYKVDIAEALGRRARQFAGNIEAFMKKDRSVEVRAEAQDGVDLDKLTTIKVTFPASSDTDKLDQAFLREHMPDYEVGDVSDAVVTLVMRDDAITRFTDESLEQAIETIERRVNEFGVAESTISKRGESELVVQLPGVKEADFAQAKEKLAQTGQLRFQIVDRDGMGEFFQKVAERAPQPDAWPEGLSPALKPHKVVANANGVRSTSRELIEHMVAGLLDKDHIVGFQEIFVDPNDANLTSVDTLSKDQERALRKADANLDAPITKGYELYYLWSIHGMSGENVEDASVGYDSFNRPVVLMRFSQIDADRFYQMTKSFTKELMAIMIDEIVYSAPRIKEPIGGGRVQIELGVGPTAQKDAQNLVAVLKSGALQAPLRKLYDSQVGPSLGADSIAAGRLSVTIGFIAVVLFMLIYYKGAGLIANLALFLNLLFVMAGLTAFGATLTLPGIAGIVLTVGMAVDANVLIFERIREELRRGIGVRKAIDAGYEKAFSAILDANVTTGIAALVLYQFGSGPIRGFAVTLAIGVACSMYTALIVTRLIFGYLYGRGAEPAKISI